MNIKPNPNKDIVAIKKNVWFKVNLLGSKFHFELDKIKAEKVIRK